MALFCLVGGCWQEIEYTSPDPKTTVPRRTLPDAAPAAPAEPAAQVAAEPNERQQAPPEVPHDLTTAVETPEPTAETSAAEPLPFDVEEPETAEAPPVNVDAPAVPPVVEETPIDSTAVSPVANTRRAAWLLGSKLSLAALANDRGLAADDVPKWLADAADAAKLLGTSFDPLPERGTEAGSEGEATNVHDYLFEQGKRIWQDLSSRHGRDHAALFEVAVKTNVLLVLYAPGAPDVEAMSKSIADSAPRAQLPPELWQPLLDAMDKQAAAADVRTAVRRLHEDADKHLSEAVEH